MKERNLLFRAGPLALKHIREKGLSPDDVTGIAGAAGGPKWLVLNGLDHALFGEWFSRRTKDLHMVGSSIGSWRFAALASGEGMSRYESFKEAYISQHYEKRPIPKDVTDESYRIMDTFLGSNGIRNILSHPFMRIVILSVRSRYLLSSDRALTLGAGLGIAALANALSRRSLRLFFERTLFHDSRISSGIVENHALHGKRVPLNIQNFRSALMSSGSIPMVMSGISDIPGAPHGTYRDGGLVDYHLDIPFDNDRTGLVIYPHYANRIIPGWFDKKIRSRKIDPSNYESVLVLSPSEGFSSGLPHGRIPDRNDFYRFHGRDRDRISFWNKTVEKSKMLGDDFLEAVETGNISSLVQPLY